MTDLFNVADMASRGERLARTEREILIDIADLLTRQTAVLEHILAQFGQSADSRSSVEIKTSTRGVDIAAKSYAGSEVAEQVEPAVTAYFDAMRLVQERLNVGTAP